MFFFNNCNTFDHAKGYGIPDAFFDLATTGFQATQATHFRPAKYASLRQKNKTGRFGSPGIHFRVWRRSRTKNSPWRVFCGSPLKSEKLSKGDAARDGICSIFFDKNGNFKRQSVLQR
jgi:hypothetical protein